MELSSRYQIWYHFLSFIAFLCENFKQKRNPNLDLPQELRVGLRRLRGSNPPVPLYARMPVFQVFSAKK